MSLPLNKRLEPTRLAPPVYSRATCRAAQAQRSAGAGVESVVAVDFRHRMTDGILKQQC